MSIKRLIREFGCDHQYCLATIRVATGSTECGTDYEGELTKIRKRGWVVYGLNQYCKAHKDHHNWGTVMTERVKQ